MTHNPDELIRRGWSPGRVKAELRERGHTLASLNRLHGKNPSYFSVVLKQPNRFGEKVIADIIGVHPSEIWPGRYGPDGLPYVGRFLPENDGLRAKGAKPSPASKASS